MLCSIEIKLCIVKKKGKKRKRTPSTEKESEPEEEVHSKVQKVYNSKRKTKYLRKSVQ